MAVDLPKRTYSGTIREIVVGKGDKSFKVGGETAYPFYTFEGAMPNPPKFGLDIMDIEPDDWADELKSAHRAPSVTVLLVGNNPASEVYVGRKGKACSRVGITMNLVRCDAHHEVVQTILEEYVGEYYCEELDRTYSLMIQKNSFNFTEKVKQSIGSVRIVF